MSDRRNFIKKTALGAVGLSLSSPLSMSAKSYNNIVGANDRLHVAIAGLGRRLGAFDQPIALKSSNVRLLYLCDPMQSQLDKAALKFEKLLKYKPKLETDFFKVIDDTDVDVLINATPDHWHAPGSIMAMKAGKHVYVEKPSSCTMEENELLVNASKTYGKVVQMGNQQRSSQHTINLIDKIYNGAIGDPYKAIAFYNNQRGEVPLQQKSPIPEGLDWNLWQGPAVHRDYTSETWNYNWHWYGWNYGTAEIGNNGTHELDVARWALNVKLPERADVMAYKRHFVNDGWEMYDTMNARFRFSGDKVIEWDGSSRNGYATYGEGKGRGVVIYGTNGSAYVDRERYDLYDRAGKLIESSESESEEAGNALGGGGGMSTLHVVNFFDTVRGKTQLKAPIEDANISMAMVHYGNVSARIGRGFDIDPNTGYMFDKDAMALWSKPYEPGWKKKFEL